MLKRNKEEELDMMCEYESFEYAQNRLTKAFEMLLENGTKRDKKTVGCEKGRSKVEESK